MPTPLSPIVSEFATVEEAESYDAWFRAKVQKSLDSTDPRRYTNEEVMNQMRALLDAKRTAKPSSK
ncbi:stability determinant [Undibacterium sp. TC9W]|uniref:type II toxin-antitoxin system RelB family antitoxin n=1 Tax=Undibacterium sp. TC9W TaxID=3413053 RepID=UPI003BEF78F2